MTDADCTCEGVWLGVTAVEGVMLAVVDAHMLLSIATAEADSAVLNMRAFEIDPVKISPLACPRLPFQPRNTPGDDGIAWAESEQDATELPSTYITTVGLEYVTATWCQTPSHTLRPELQSLLSPTKLKVDGANTKSE